MALKLMFITNDIEIAKIAQKNKVDRIWIDLETLGKEERQKGMNTVKSNHTIEDIIKMRKIIKESELLVRVNPINKDSKVEIERVIEAGADIIMLPMWKSASDVAKFLNLVNKRVKTTLLLETKEAVECLDEVLENGGFDEIHIGLNDLHLSYKLKFMFEPLINGLLEEICGKIKKYDIPFGFGGIAKLGTGELQAEKIIMEHYYLGSTRVILSRSFCNIGSFSSVNDIEMEFTKNIKDLMEFQKTINIKNINCFLANRHEIKIAIQKIKEKKYK